MTQDTGLKGPHPPPVDRLSALWRRINEHKLVQWSVAYIAVAYAFQHAVVLTSEAFEWPEAVLRVSMLLMALGLPVVVTLAWYHGERASRHFSTAELTIISLLLVIGSVVFYAAVQPNQEIATEQAPPAQRDGVEKARGEANSPATAISVAVLPFENLSGDASQEFFSDGITEEITAALSKIPDLRVVARGSAFQFKNEKRDRRAVGQALGATHLIDGSVRKAADRVRITVQLIRADSGLQVWSENYDRNLTDIFAIQEDIARATAASFNMQVGLAPGLQLVSSRNIDPESYQQYLRARALHRGRLGGGLKALNDAIALLEQVVARNPNYAPAWGLLADVHDTSPNYTPVVLSTRTASLDEVRQVVQSSLSKAEPAARRAIQLDPNLADGYRSLADMQLRAGRLLEAEELYSKTLSLDPNNPETLSSYSSFLANVGRVSEALGVQQQLQELEPFVPIVNRDTALILWLNGQDDAALELLRRIGGSNRFIAIIQAGAGRYNEAADTLLSLPSGAPTPPAAVLQEAVRLLRIAPSPVASQSVKSLPGLDFVYLYVGAPGQVLEYYEVNVGAGWRNAQHRLLSHPSFGPARKTERYKAYARKAGLVDYWRVRGWPEFCRPTTGDDFECS
jgi:TolB-like protein